MISGTDLKNDPVFFFKNMVFYKSSIHKNNQN